MIALQLIAILVCMGLQAFFAGIETGVISIHRMRLRHFVRRGVPGVVLLQEYLDNTDRLLGTTLVGTNLCVVVASVLAAGLASRALPRGGEAVATVLVTLLVLVFGEYLPKAWFHARPLERCRRFVGPLRLAETLFKPLSVTIIGITRLLVPGERSAFRKPTPFVTREDLKALASESEEDGVISRRERVMIHRVFELSGKKARDIMVPLDQVVKVYSDMSVPEFYNLARNRGFTRMPVYNRERDLFEGTVNVFQVLASHHADTAATIRPFLRPPLFIRGDKPVDDIFPLLRRARQPMCLVRSDTNEVLGLITTEDILEEIVGKLQ